jgi:DNA polymerase-3 subunit epsilon
VSGDEPFCPLFEGPVAFVDVETTGVAAESHRVIDVAIVGATGGTLDFEWSTLVDPGWTIPFGIQRYTGITDDMVRGAPAFEDIADDVVRRLEGRLFVAHNAGFDHRFVRAELARAGHRWSGDKACTVRLSRRLYPDMPRHSLDYVIARHGLVCGQRHRALGDAQVLWQFWNVLRAERQFGEVERVLAAMVRPVKAKPRRKIVRFAAGLDAA